MVDIIDEIDGICERTLAEANFPGVRMRLWEYTLDQPKDLKASGQQRDFVLLISKPQSGKVRSWYRLGPWDSYAPFNKLVCAPPAAVETHFSGRGTGHAFSCSFDPDFLRDHTGWDCDLSDIGQRTGCTSDRPLMKETMWQLFRELSAPGFSSHLVVESLSRVLAVETARHFKARPRAAESLKGCLAHWQLDQIQEYVETAVEQDVTIKDLAKICGLNADYLRRLFKASTGQSLGAYIEHIRVLRAKALLSHGEMTIKQISTQLGFASPSGFSIAFRRGTGETPRMYQRRTHAQ